VRPVLMMAKGGFMDLKAELLKRAEGLEAQAKAIRAAAKALNGHAAKVGVVKRGHTRRKCQLVSCGKGFIGHADQLYCSYAHGAAARYAAKRAGPTAKAVNTEARGRKPTTLLKGDGLSQINARVIANAAGETR